MKWRECFTTGETQIGFFEKADYFSKRIDTVLKYFSYVSRVF
jgi:hypothetical protein